jgi:hypothetical protein
MINLIIGLVVGSVITLFTVSLLKAASDADDKLLGDDQYK